MKIFVPRIPTGEPIEADTLAMLATPGYQEITATTDGQGVFEITDFEIQSTTSAKFIIFLDGAKIRDANISVSNTQITLLNGANDAVQSDSVLEVYYFPFVVSNYIPPVQDSTPAAIITNGYNNYLYQDDLIMPTANWEMECDVKFSDLKNQIIVSKSDAGANNQAGWALALVDDTINFYTSLANNNYATANAITDVNIAPNTYYHVYIYRDATNNKIGISINNSLAVEADSPTFSVSNAPFMIGRDSSPTQDFGFYGSISRLRMWSRLRSTQERSDAFSTRRNFNQLSSGEKQNIVFAYDFLSSTSITADEVGSYPLVKNGVVNATSSGPIPQYRVIAFDRQTGGAGYGGKHYIAGDNTKAYTVELPYTYTPPNGTSLADVCLFMKTGDTQNIWGVHSGYEGPSTTPPYVSDSLVIFKGPIVRDATQNTAFTVVHEINMANHITQTIGGFTGLGPSPIVCSGEKVLFSDGRVGLFFMYQPNGLNTSNSYIMYIESTDATLTSWGNATLVTGTQLTWDQGDYATGKMGSAIDPFYFFKDGVHYLLIRLFSANNGASTCLGMGLYSSTTSRTSGYNTLVCDLRITSKGGTNPYMNEHMEGAFFNFEDNGDITFSVDDSGALQSKWCTIANGDFANVNAYGPFTNITSPGGYPLGHHSPVKIPQ